MPVLIQIPAQLFLASLLIASALLGAWTVSRFSRMGPHTLSGAFLALIAAMMLITGLPSFIDGVFAAGIPGAREVVIFGLVLPTFTYFFVAGGWFMRSILRLAGPFD